MNADAKRQRIVLCLVLTCAVGLAWALMSPAGRKTPRPLKPAAPSVQPAPICPPDCPNCPNCPKRPRRPWGPRLELAVAGNPEPAVDLLALPERKRNITSRGLGCCTFRATEYAAKWQGVPVLEGFPEWLVSKGIPGGGNPPKMEEMIGRIAQDRGVPVPGFVQYEGPNYAQFIELVLRTGRVACVTWQDTHMLNCVHLDTASCGILDNNDPNRVQWFSRADGLRRIGGSRGIGWVLALTSPAPPPPPRARQIQTWRCGKDCPCGSLCTCGCNQGLPCRCGNPWTPAPAPVPAPKEEEYKGVIWTAPAGERWTYCGQEIDQHLVEAELKDDSTRPYLTVIGTKAERDRVLAALGSLAEEYRVHGYDPTDWAVAAGFVRAGHPTVYLQDPSGVPLFRRDSAEDLAELAGALRRADPAYDPSQDPDGRAVVPGLPSWLTGERALVGLLGVGGVAGAWWLLSRSSQPAPMPAQPQSQPVSDLARRIEAQLQAQIASELMARLGAQQPPRS